MLAINVWERLRSLMTDGSEGLERCGEGRAQNRYFECMCVCVCVGMCLES
jgi:hypothetical protein